MFDGIFGGGGAALLRSGASAAAVAFFVIGLSGLALLVGSGRIVEKFGVAHLLSELSVRGGSAGFSKNCG